MNLRTNCKGCVFSKLDDQGDQNGCSLGRHKLLGILEENDHYTLERFCNTYRPDEWLESLNFEQSLNPMTTVLEEVSVRVGYILNICDEHSEENVQTIMQAVSQVDPSWIVVVTSGPEWNDFVWETFIQIFGEASDVNYHIVQVGKDQAVKTLVDRGFKHAENGWVYLLKSSKGIPDLLQHKKDLDRTLNEDLKQLVMVENSNHDDHELCFPAYLFKFLNGNRTKIYEDELADSRPFVVKIREAEARTKNKTVYTWDEINEKTS
tara:strand:- start:1845 stop:2636 length:792 start_codon:yes stop_codon:yes gene_type:complete